MQTVNDMLEVLLDLKEKGYGNLPLIYSTDDEGNSYHKIYHKPSLSLVEDLDEWDLEIVYMEDDEEFEPNCVTIN